MWPDNRGRTVHISMLYLFMIMMVCLARQVLDQVHWFLLIFFSRKENAFIYIICDCEYRFVYTSFCLSQDQRWKANNKKTTPHSYGHMSLFSERYIPFDVWRTQKAVMYKCTPIKLALCSLIINRAVYTGIKKPEFFSHSGFSLEVARQLPLNIAKNPNRKTHLRSVVFWNSAGFSLFFANVNARSPLAGIIRVFGHVGRDLPETHTQYAALRSRAARSRACATRTQKTVWDSGFFAHALFLPKPRKVMGFSGSVNGATKNPGFLYFGFCQCKWALYWTTLTYIHVCPYIIFLLPSSVQEVD